MITTHVFVCKLWSLWTECSAADQYQPQRQNTFFSFAMSSTMKCGLQIVVYSTAFTSTFFLCIYWIFFSLSDFRGTHVNVQGGWSNLCYNNHNNPAMMICIIWQNSSDHAAWLAFIYIYYLCKTPVWPLRVVHLNYWKQSCISGAIM